MKSSRHFNSSVPFESKTTAMSYHILLTGATGLLGRYLLRNLLLADVPVAVVVRGIPRPSAEDRVEALMGTWEHVLQPPLPQPQVVEGDIYEPPQRPHAAP